jgi:hypothetical protein
LENEKRGNRVSSKIEGYVFVVTYGRSGSTAIQSILQSIPGYHISGENYNCLFPLYEAVCLASVARFEHGKNPHAEIDPWFGANKIQPDQFASKLADAFVEEILQPPTGTRVTGFKEIRFHRVGQDHFKPFLNFIHTHFAPCKFIFNTRGWREIVRSGWWRNQRPERVEEIIREADTMFADYLARYPERGILLRHEETRVDPAAFKPMFDFLEEPFDLEKITEVSSRKLGHSGV